MKHPQQHPELFALARLQPMGGDLFKLVPDTSTVLAGGETWVGGRKAAALLGLPWHDGCKSLDRLRETGILRSRRITPGKIEYELQSLLAHKKACEDPEVWNGKELKR